MMLETKEVKETKEVDSNWHKEPVEVLSLALDAAIGLACFFETQKEGKPIGENFNDVWNFGETITDVIEDPTSCFRSLSSDNKGLLIDLVTRIDRARPDKKLDVRILIPDSRLYVKNELIKAGCPDPQATAEKIESGGLCFYSLYIGEGGEPVPIFFDNKKEDALTMNSPKMTIWASDSFAEDQFDPDQLSEAEKEYWEAFSI